MSATDRPTTARINPPMSVTPESNSDYAFFHEDESCPCGAAVALDLRSHESLLVAAYALRGASSLTDDDDTAQWLEMLAQQFEDDATATKPTPAPVGAAVALDLDAIEAAALADDGWWSVPVPALVAEVRRLAEEAREARALTSIHSLAMLKAQERAEAAEADAVTLRAKVAAVEAIHGRTHWCFGGDDPDDLRDNIVFEPNTEWWPCPTFAALATTGEGQ